jgi:hypothetical protein
MEPVPEDSEAKNVEGLEAHEIAAQRVVDLRAESHEHLVASYLNRYVYDEIVGATGTTFDATSTLFGQIVHLSQDLSGLQSRPSEPRISRIVSPEANKVVL